TGRSERSSRSDARVKGTGYLYGMIVEQVPREAVHPFVCGNCFWPLDAIWPFRRLFTFFFLFAGEMPDEFARSIQNIERDFFFRSTLEIVIDNRARRRVITNWLALVEFLRIMQTHCVFRLIKNYIHLGRLGAELTQRFEVVELMPIHGNIRAVSIVWRRIDETDCAPLGHLWCDL